MVAIWTEANVDQLVLCWQEESHPDYYQWAKWGEVDIIEYDEEPVRFIANSLAPAKVVSIELDEEEHKAIVKVDSDKLSLAIGKNGQNVRLAARLTGWKIDIIEETDSGEEKKVVASDGESTEMTTEDSVEIVSEERS